MTSNPVTESPAAADVMARQGSEGLEEEDVLLIASAESMSDATFLKHMNARHMPLGGMSSMGDRIDRTVPAFRKYHRRLHRLAYQGAVANHVHEEG